jgi:hypothetical protein
MLVSKRTQSKFVLAFVLLPEMLCITGGGAAACALGQRVRDDTCCVVGGRARQCRSHSLSLPVFVSKRTQCSRALCAWRCVVCAWHCPARSSSRCSCPIVHKARVCWLVFCFRRCYASLVAEPRLVLSGIVCVTMRAARLMGVRGNAAHTPCPARFSCPSVPNAPGHCVRGDAWCVRGIAPHALRPDARVQASTKLGCAGLCFASGDATHHRWRSGGLCARASCA